MSMGGQILPEEILTQVSGQTQNSVSSQCLGAPLATLGVILGSTRESWLPTAAAQSGFGALASERPSRE